MALLDLTEELEPVNDAIVSLSRRVQALEQIRPSKRLCFKVQEIVEYTGISERKVYGLLRNGDLPGRKMGAHIIVMYDDLIGYLEALPKVCQWR
jgi:excisionase family DNA binding protein